MPRKPAQTSFLTHPALHDENRCEHGGTLGHGRRKRFRPTDPRKPLHVVLRSESARGELSMLRARHEKRVKHLVYWSAQRHRVRVYKFANSGNHLHLVIFSKTRDGYKNYLRTLSGMIARAVTGAKKGVKKGKFWDALAYSKVISRGRELRALNFYVIMNELETQGIWLRNFRSRAGSREGPDRNVAA